MKALWNALRLRSSTLNFNALALILFALDVLSGTGYVQADPELAVLVPLIGNVLLRFKTNKAVGDK